MNLSCPLHRYFNTGIKLKKKQETCTITNHTVIKFPESSTFFIKEKIIRSLNNLLLSDKSISTIITFSTCLLLAIFLTPKGSKTHHRAKLSYNIKRSITSQMLLLLK